MSKLYVFGIGGTGARVLRSLTHLLAAGVECRDTIVPVLIDPDTNNGDLTRSISLLQRYVAVRSYLRYDNSTENRFLSTEIMEKAGFRLPVKNAQDLIFKDFMELSEMNDASKALMKMLYSERNLNSDMVVGFKGNPNVGSIVLNQFSDTQEFIDLANDFNQGDRIFIVSSIFGGTGASGFPLLLKTLRTNRRLPHFGYLNDAVIGAITVLPYFKVEAVETSSIESDTFISKTRSALAYYDKNLSGKLEAMYYIGDNTTAHESYENSEGGDEQKNKAHLVELLSALAVLDFANNDFERGQTRYKEFGLEREDVKSVIFGDFAQGTRDVIRRPLTQVMLMTNYLHKVNIEERLRQQWSIDFHLDKTFYGGEFFSNLTAWLNDFVVWLKEMEDNQRSFAPFAWNVSELFGIVKGVPPSKSIWPLAKNNYQLFDKVLDHTQNVNGSLSKEQAFMELFFRATSKLISDKLKF